MKCENEEKTNKWIKASIDVNGDACFNENPTNSHIHTHIYILTHTPYIIICVHIFIYIYLGEFDLSVSNECASTTLFDNIHEFPRFLLFQYRKICKFLQTVYEPSHCDLRRTFIYLWKRIPCPFFLARHIADWSEKNKADQSVFRKQKNDKFIYWIAIKDDIDCFFSSSLIFFT